MGNRDIPPEDMNEYSDRSEDKQLVPKSFIESEEKLDGKKRLDFAKSVLLGLLGLVVVVFFSSYALAFFANTNKDLMSIVASILDFTKTTIPSFATLILGFYFGKKDS